LLQSFCNVAKEIAMLQQGCNKVRCCKGEVIGVKQIYIYILKNIYFNRYSKSCIHERRYEAR